MMDRETLSVVGVAFAFALVGGLAFALFAELYSTFGVVVPLR